MTEFVRSIHKHVEDLFIFDIEAFCYLADNLQYHIPDSLCESKFHAAHGSIFKQSADGLVVRETSGGREQVILHGGDGGHCDLRGEVAHLVLPKSQVLLPFFEYDFQGPTHRVNPVGFNEIELSVGGYESIPLGPLSAFAEKQSYVSSGKGDIHCDIVASQTLAVLASLLGVVEKSDELIGGKLLPIIRVLGAAHLNHAKVVALDMAGGNEPDNLSTGEPTVSQYIVEVNLLLDNTLYHLYHKGNLTLVVLFDTLGCLGVFCVLLCETGIKLLLLQAVVLFLAFLADEGEVYQHLALAVGDAEEECLEAKHHGMRYMREHLTDELCLHTALGIVCVINHKAYGTGGLRGTLLLNLAPELPRNGGQNLAPVISVSRKETIKRVALAAEQAV